jgi:RNA polymerase sigma-70 factor (ECF subfamily)
LEWKELNIIIEKILKNLPQQQREILLMRDLDGYEFIEIASATELKVEHVRVLLHSAAVKVKGFVQK